MIISKENYEYNLANVLEYERHKSSVDCNTTRSHLDIAKLCLYYNKHLRSDRKTYMSTYEEALELQEYHNKVSKLRVFVDHTFLFPSCYQQVSIY